MAGAADGSLKLAPHTELPAAISAAILGQIACGRAVLRPCHVQVGIDSINTFAAPSGANAALPPNDRGQLQFSRFDLGASYRCCGSCVQTSGVNFWHWFPGSANIPMGTFVEAC